MTDKTTKLSKERIQLIVVCVIVGIWIAALVISQFDGNEMLKVLTPLMTLVFGWLFAEKATAPNANDELAG